MSITKDLKEQCPWWVKASVARLKRTGIILMYHRVSDSSLDPYSLNVSPRNFDEQMQVIKKYGKTLRMQEMVENISKFQANDEIAVTFDDGFADNYHYARPILEKHGVSATFYIPSHAIETQEEFWWDRLTRILTVSSLPDAFEASIHGHRYHLKVETNIKFLFDVWHVMRPLPFEHQNEFVDRLLAWCGFNGHEDRQVAMTLNELIDMSRCGLFEIGAHTVHHPLLSAWPVQKQEEEISTGRQRLEEWINKKVTSFAYPFGDYSSETIEILPRLKFQNACTIVARPVYRGTNPFLLGRFMVFNWNGDEFEEKLREWLIQRTEG